MKKTHTYFLVVAVVFVIVLLYAFLILSYMVLGKMVVIWNGAAQGNFKDRLWLGLVLFGLALVLVPWLWKKIRRVYRCLRSRVIFFYHRHEIRSELDRELERLSSDRIAWRFVLDWERSFPKAVSPLPSLRASKQPKPPGKRGPWLG